MLTNKNGSLVHLGFGSLYYEIKLNYEIQLIYDTWESEKVSKFAIFLTPNYVNLVRPQRPRYPAFLRFPEEPEQT